MRTKNRRMDELANLAWKDRKGRKPFVEQHGIINEKTLNHDSTGMEDAAGNPERMKEALGLLKQYFGYEMFRPGQREIVSVMLKGRDCLGVVPTSGLSLFRMLTSGSGNEYNHAAWLTKLARS